jgi:hypothetical protein
VISGEQLRSLGKPGRKGPLSDEAQGEWPTVARYFLVCLATVVGCFTLVAVGFAGLRIAGDLPPPIVTNNLCFDEKLHWMSHQLPTKDADLLVFGSSVAWRHFDGEKAVESGFAKSPFNLGFCGLRMSQTAFVTKYFLNKEKFRSPLQVIIIASPQDFEGCNDREERVFLESDVDKTVFSSSRSLAAYLRNVDALAFVRNAIFVKAMRSGTIALDPLVFTNYGDGPLDTGQSRGLTYGHIQNLNQPCFSALTDIAKRLTDQNIKTIFVLNPVNPRWISEYDPDRRILNDVRVRSARALRGFDVLIWDASESSLFSVSDFVDAFHLRWSAVRRFTAAMAAFATGG